ncbi:ABC transporter substrate-binding protein [Pseudacidovorax intermedius]|uniref:ABC transporter substrate-binding protein n=1 Tax=Pseudacidovorax intermedius TaxID=433924 RepID=UPI001B137192|nr:ABC transporter substrate-binding protein [Pseudacidovorax intermedius]MBO9643396.1 ABC transporter substrate-binding protein [Pseudacidovorax sp.]
MLHRRAFCAAAAAGAALAIAPGVRTQPRLEKNRVVIAVAGKASFYYLPLTLSEQLGYFRAEGLDVEVVDHAAGARALQALLSGSADICSGAFEHTLNLQAGGQFFPCFVLQGRAPQVAMGTSTKGFAAYQAVPDLRGRRVGVSAVGSATHMMASLVAARGGLRPADVQYVGVGSSAGALSALRTGQVDAMSNSEPVMTMLEQKGDVKLIADCRTLRGTAEVFGGPMPAACLYASEDFLRRAPNTAQAVANAVVHSLKWLQTAGPGDLIKALPESHLLGDRALYLAAFDKVRESIALDGLVPPEGPRTALAAMTTFDASFRPERIELDRLYTNDFAQRAKERYKA